MNIDLWRWYVEIWFQDIQLGHLTFSFSFQEKGKNKQNA